MSPFRSQQQGFTGAEKALMICIALAIIAAVGYLLSGGSRQAGGDARRTLEAGSAALGAMQGTGKVLGSGALPAALAPAAPSAGLRTLPNGLDDKAYDGAIVGADGKVYPAGTPISLVPAVQPANGNPQGTIIYVNGISNTKDDQYKSMQDIANTSGDQVIGIHNATEGAIKDIAQSAGDKFNIGHNPAVDTLSDTIYDSIERGQPIHLMGHSQGALITSRALFDVRRRLLIEDGLSESEVEKRMGLITVETFGGAASSYPDGPHYTHYVNLLDPVPMAFGLGMPGSYGGKDAKIIRFTDSKGGGVSLQNPFTWPPSSPVKVELPNVHGLTDVYLPHRQPGP